MLVIWMKGVPRRPWERYQEEIDDWGIKYKAKMGSVVAPHWARMSGDYLIEEKDPISKWHRDWQNTLEEVCNMGLEVTKKDTDNPKLLRRADALCEDRKVVVEVQYSPMSETDIYTRTGFWRELGYQVIWLFDYKKWDGIKENTRLSRKPLWYFTKDLIPGTEIFIEDEDEMLHQVTNYKYLSRARSYKHSLWSKIYSRDSFLECINDSASKK